MKKTILYAAFTVLTTGFVLTSCEDMFGEFLDKQPSNELTGKEVFSLWSNTEKFHYDTYNYLRHGAKRINDSWLDAATDLGHTSYNGGTRTSFNIGNYYSAGGAAELTSTWSHYYRAIRKCNMLLENIGNVPKPADNDEIVFENHKKNFKAESRFLRAYFYWELFLRYGPVPIVEEVLDPDGDLLTGYTERPSNKEYTDFILRELTECEEDLMAGHENKDNLIGRVNKPMAKALKSRILLYMASPRYELATWQEAANAANDFIETYGANYELHYGNTNDPMRQYGDAILQPVHEGNTEVIFWRNDGLVGWDAIYNDTPVGEGGQGGLCPSQNLVDMYDMVNGLSPFTNYDNTGAPVYNSNGVPAVNAASGYDESTPYANRDPRFYQTVIYHQSVWNDATIDVRRGGRDNPVGSAYATPTGYYVKKYIPEGILGTNHSGSRYRNWIFIRSAEILLNYAEAMNEVSGPTDEVFDALQQIRDRAGMTALLKNRTDLQSKDAMRNFIRKERTIELAFEEHRWWDVRRWNVAEKALARPIYGVEVTNGTNGPVYTRKQVQKRVFSEKMYLYPIPEQEVWKTSIENNPGW